MYQPADRFAVLRDLLKRPLKGDADTIKLLREIGYAVLYIADDLLTLADIRASLMRIEKTLLEFIEESLQYRQKRLKRERVERPDDSELEIEEASTKDVINKLKDRSRQLKQAAIESTASVPTMPLPAEQSTKEKHWLIKFTETFAPFAAGAIGLELLKALLKLAYGGNP